MASMRSVSSILPTPETKVFKSIIHVTKYDSSRLRRCLTVMMHRSILCVDFLQALALK